MSIIAAMLGWTKLPQWALELIVMGVIAGGIWYWHHEAIEKGIADQVALDNTAAAKLRAQTAAETANLKAKATMAEQGHAKEIDSLNDYNRAHPIEPVRLCDAHASSPLVPARGAADPGNAGAGAATPGLQSVPGGDSGSGTGTAGPDISPMLSALGAAADKLSAELREYQSR